MSTGDMSGGSPSDPRPARPLALQTTPAQSRRPQMVLSSVPFTQPQPSAQPSQAGRPTFVLSSQPPQPTSSSTRPNIVLQSDRRTHMQLSTEPPTSSSSASSPQNTSSPSPTRSTGSPAHGPARSTSRPTMTLFSTPPSQAPPSRPQMTLSNQPVVPPNTSSSSATLPPVLPAGRPTMVLFSSPGGGAQPGTNLRRVTDEVTQGRPHINIPSSSVHPNLNLSFATSTPVSFHPNADPHSHRPCTDCLFKDRPSISSYHPFTSSTSTANIHAFNCSSGEAGHDTSTAPKHCSGFSLSC